MSQEPERGEAKLVSRAFVDEQPRQIADPVRVAIDAAVRNAATMQTTVGQETGDLAQLGALRDVSWRQHEALPGMLAKRGMQGGAIGLVAYVLYRLFSSRVRS